MCYDRMRASPADGKRLHKRSRQAAPAQHLEAGPYKGTKEAPVGREAEDVPVDVLPARLFLVIKHCRQRPASGEQTCETRAAKHASELESLHADIARGSAQRLKDDWV